MAYVYILYSERLQKHYIGSCQDLDSRLLEHSERRYQGSFTTRAGDWVLVFCAGDLTYGQARKIEGHIKRMKSKKYIENLIRFEEMIIKLKELYK